MVAIYRAKNFFISKLKIKVKGSNICVYTYTQIVHTSCILKHWVILSSFTKTDKAMCMTILNRPTGQE